MFGGDFGALLSAMIAMLPPSGDANSSSQPSSFLALNARCEMRDIPSGSGAEPGGTGFSTRIGELPVVPRLVALMLAVPTPTAVTTPESETVATPALLDDQVSGRP